MNITKKISMTLLIIGISSTFMSCSTPKQASVEPQLFQMKSIAELATMDVYFHNVAKFNEKDATGILLWKKDKNFWIEYSGIVEIGIDASLLDVEVVEENVTIQIPEAKVLGSKVDDATLSKDSFIVDNKSADISAEDEIQAFKEAQENMVLEASQDQNLLASAQENARKLLEEYILNIGEEVGQNYSIEWIYLKGK